ncbi:Ribosomal protein S18 acetylase RimI [Modicisalibacter muralis]|uniref:Ribosomal protein S18 acetylase RimI n=1 Tax=Modicisalibacter muralis TaxID=119000 RepID=A0A1G9L144_9GAMM|nr:Ribosomal protein S18 acetylase RimI [Halomonas muralis]
MHIRHATTDDLDALVSLLEGYRQFYRQPRDAERARAFLEARFAREDSLILLAVDERDRPFGFTQLFPTLNTVRLTSRWVLNDLFVDPEARRQGAGKALLEAARAHCEAVGVGEMRLATQVDNRAAKTLYESLGWQRVAGFDHYTLVLT